MTAENTAQPTDLNEETRAIWDQNAAFWDDRMGDGNDFQRILIGPTSERLLNLQAGETVLEIACGNGVFARRMAQLGVHVVATDFSEQLLERARAHTSKYADRIDYRLVDATREDQIVALGQQHFDAAIIFTSYHQSALPAAYLCYLADIPLRLAASIDGPGSLLTTRHKHPERMMHEVERGLDLVGAVGLTTPETDLVLRVPVQARESIFDLLSSRGVDPRRPFVVVHAGCSMPARTYPWEMYAAVVDLLIERCGATVALSGSDEERELVERILGRTQAHHRQSILPLAGALSFPDLCALIEAADLTITNNTGPMHISAAVKTPVIALFALTNPPQQWGPWHVLHRQMYHDVPCRICYSRICPYQHECLRLVTPQMVVDASAELLASINHNGNCVGTDVSSPHGLSIPQTDWIHRLLRRGVL